MPKGNQDGNSRAAGELPEIPPELVADLPGFEDVNLPGMETPPGPSEAPPSPSPSPTTTGSYSPASTEAVTILTRTVAEAVSGVGMIANGLIGGGPETGLFLVAPERAREIAAPTARILARHSPARWLAGKLGGDLVDGVRLLFVGGLFVTANLAAYRQLKLAAERRHQGAPLPEPGAPGTVTQTGQVG